jgi:Kef-type K+ transport system membrane component KefB
VHITLITLLVIMMALVSDLVGASNIVGPLLMGLVFPIGPPLGTALIRHIDAVATELLVPLIFICVGRQIDWEAASQELSHGLWLLLLILLPSLAKVVAVTFAAYYCGFSLKKGALLGLIMNFKGIMEALLIVDFKIYTVCTYDYFFYSFCTIALPL